MSSNLNRDKCDCGYQFNLSDFRGKPVEFRQSGDYCPQMGVKLVCPKCDKVYFGWIDRDHSYWGDDTKHQFDKEYINIGHGYVLENRHVGKFAKRVLNPLDDKECVVDLGSYRIDLSYYETHSDEGQGIDTDNPSDLFTKCGHELTWWRNSE